MRLQPDWPALAQEAWDEVERNADPKQRKAEEPVNYTISWMDNPKPVPPQSDSP